MNDQELIKKFEEVHQDTFEQSEFCKTLTDEELVKYLDWIAEKIHIRVLEKDPVKKIHAVLKTFEFPSCTASEFPTYMVVWRLKNIIVARFGKKEDGASIMNDQELISKFEKTEQENFEQSEFCKTLTDEELVKYLDWIAEKIDISVSEKDPVKKAYAVLKKSEFPHYMAVWQLKDIMVARLGKKAEEEQAEEQPSEDEEEEIRIPQKVKYFSAFKQMKPIICCRSAFRAFVDVDEKRLVLECSKCGKKKFVKILESEDGQK